MTRSTGLAAPLPWKSRSFNSQMRTIPSLPPVLAHVKRTFPKQQFLRIEILNFQASERYQNIDRNGISWECNKIKLERKKGIWKKKDVSSCVQPVKTSALCHSGQPNMTRFPSGDHRAETIKCLVPCPARDRHWELTLSSQTTKYVHCTWERLILCL